MTNPTAAIDMLTPEHERFVQRSLLGDAWMRLRRNRLAVLSLAFIVVLLLMAVFAPVVATHDPKDTNFGKDAQYQGFSSSHWLGTDGAGRDWYSRLVYGTRVSLKVGLLSQVIVLLIGLPIGLVAGYVGGRTDALLMRFTDLAYAFPSLLFILLIAQVLGPSVRNIYIAIGLVSWVDIARLLRGQILSLRTMDYITSARSTGATAPRIMWRHLLPNALGPMIVSVTFGIPSAIFAEAALSFIGVGLPIGTPSWGTMINDGYGAVFGQQILVIPPAAILGLTLLAFTFLGDGLRDALDPRTR